MRRKQWMLLAASLLATAVLCALAYACADVPAARYFFFRQHTFWHALGNWGSKLGESQWYLVPSALIALICWHSRALLARRALFVFVSVAGTGIAVNLLKVGFGRLRPKLFFEDNLYGFHPFGAAMRDLSFPSGHATTAFALAVSLGYLFPRWRWLLYPLGAMIALSRVLVVRHWVSDVIAGAWLGAVGAILCWKWLLEPAGDDHESS